MNVRKRSGKVVPFDAEFIRRAITLAAAAAGEHDPDGVDRVTEAVQASLEALGQEIVDIERIQDTVRGDPVQAAALPHRQDLYSLSGAEGEGAGQRPVEGRHPDTGVSEPLQTCPQPHGAAGRLCLYPHLFPVSAPAGTAGVLVGDGAPGGEYNTSLAPTSREEAEKLYDNIYNLRQFLSGRTLWVGGTPVADKVSHGQLQLRLYRHQRFHGLP